MYKVRDQKGRTIGLIYKGPNMPTETTMSEAQVRNRLDIYKKRYQDGNKSKNVLDAIDFWQHALLQFSEQSGSKPEEAATT
jgi:uncharacterized protein YcsI (UPF0317 family)